MTPTPRTDAEIEDLSDERFSDLDAFMRIAKLARQLERELEQERQDRKQADLDTIRALGERNDAGAALAAITCEEGELWELRQANARMKDNLATLSKLHAEELAKAQKSFEFQLAAERALADRLAHCLADLQCEYRPMEAKRAFEDWKAARTTPTDDQSTK